MPSWSAAQIAAGPWCTRCGHPARATHNSLDDRYPLGRCLGGQPGAAGCGQVLVTRDGVLAAQLTEARRRRYVTARHHQHKPSLRPYALCDTCEADLAAARRLNPATELRAP